jgi:outer membrane protein TolC
MLADTEQLATAEIKGAVYEIVLQQRRIMLAREAVRQRRARLHELTAKRDVDEVAVFELSKARGRLFEVESELVQQVVQLEIARVRLRQAQGLLAKECGFNPTLCLEGCCHGK